MAIEVGYGPLMDIDQNVSQDLTGDKRLFLALEKQKKVPVKEIQFKFSQKWPNRPKPHRNTINKNWKKLHKYHTLETMRKGKTGRKITVRTPVNIEAVKDLLEGEANLKPDEVGSSSRRNISKTKNYNKKL